MNANSKELLKELVFEMCEEDPSMVSSVINASTSGVKSFADKQNDKASKMAFVLSQVLTECDNSKFGAFTRKDILDFIYPWLGGTKWHDDQIAALNK